MTQQNENSRYLKSAGKRNYLLGRLPNSQKQKILIVLMPLSSKKSYYETQTISKTLFHSLIFFFKIPFPVKMNSR